MKKLVFLFGFYLLFYSYSNGQCTLRGKVTDEKGETLIGVAIVLKTNRGIGTTTDLDGNYTFKIQQEGAQTLVLSYVGYLSMEENILPVNGEVIVKNFVMKSSSHEIKAVEVVAKAVKAKDYYIEKIKKHVRKYGSVDQEKKYIENLKSYFPERISLFIPVARNKTI